jgi:hypothetical protein
MRNITLAIDEQTLTMGREYARERNISFNALVRELIEKTVKPAPSNWLEETFRLADEAHASSEGRTWTREEIYDRGKNIH